MKIEIVVNGDMTLQATLYDNATARDFWSRLPLRLRFEDYHGIEKIHYLSPNLDLEDGVDGMDPAPGDITYYAPWGNLAIFLKDFSYSRGLHPIGKIDGNPDLLNLSGEIELYFKSKIQK